MTDLGLTPDDVPLGALVPVVVDGEAFVVAHHAGGWCMFADRCSHAPCAFSTNGEVVDDSVLVCNCHGAEFDLNTGDVLELPAEDPIEIIAVTPVDGSLRRTS